MSLVYNPLLLNGFQDTSAGGGGGGTTPAGSTGAIQFNDTGAFGADTANLFWDNTNKSLLLGTNSQPAGTTNVPFYVLQTNSNAGNSFLYTERVFADANANGFAFRKARGTTVTRANVLAGDGLGGITFNGYTAAGYGAGTVLVGGTAQEDFSNTTTANRGSNLLIQTTPTGASGSRRNSMSVGAGFMRLYETAGVNNIQMNSAPSASYTMSLPPALPGAGSGAFWTIGSGGSGNFSTLSGDAASGAAQGQVSVTGIRGTSVTSTAPTNNQVLLYSVGPVAWQPTTIGGDLTPTGATGAFTVSKLQTVAVSATAPTNGQVLAYDSGTTQWQPTTSSGGTPAGATSQIQFNNAGAFGATSNFTWDDSSKALNLTGGTGKSISATSTTTATYFEADSTNGVQFVMGADGPNNQNFFGSQSNHPINFRTNNTNRMSLSNTGTLTMSGTNPIAFGSDGNLAGSGGTGRLNVNFSVTQFGGGLQFLTSPIQIYMPSQDSDIRSTTNLRLAPNLGASQAAGNLVGQNAHLAFASQNGTSTIPTVITAGAAAGTSPTAPSFSTGQRDAVGQFTVNTGTSSTTGSLVTITFQGAYTNAPFVTITPANANAANLKAYVTSTTTDFTVNLAAAPTDTTAYIFNYFVCGYI